MQERRPRCLRSLSPEEDAIDDLDTAEDGDVDMTVPGDLWFARRTNQHQASVREFWPSRGWRREVRS